MSQERDNIIREYKDLFEYTSPTYQDDEYSYFDLSDCTLGDLLGGKVVILDDGETCLYVDGNGVATARILR